MNFRKGFTLIELLAVIVILGIISLIAVPQVFNIILESKEITNEKKIQMFLSTLENEIYAEKLKSNFTPNACQILDGFVSCDDKELFYSDSKISGNITFFDDEIDKYLLVLDNRYYKKNYELTDERCFRYEVVDNEISIIQYYETENNPRDDIADLYCPKDVVIPPIIDGKPVTSIRAVNDDGVISEETGMGFFGLDITNVFIPLTVKEIGFYAFGTNKLTSIVIPNSVTKIDDFAFMENNLSSIIIPDSVTTIGWEAFNKNNLISVKIGTKSSLLTSVGVDAFANDVLYPFGPNNINQIIINKAEGSIDLSKSGLLDYDCIIEWK